MFDLRSCWRAKLGGWDIAIVALALSWFAIFLALSILQYQTGHNRSFDLALYARSLWGIAHGETLNPLRDQHVLALHGHFILYALAPIARFLPSATLLLTLQSLAVAAGALAVYAITVVRLDSKPAAFAVALMYLAYPVGSNAVLFDMHVKTLATPFLLLAIDGLDRHGISNKLAWLWLLVALSCREEIALAVGVMGLAWLAFPDKRAVGASLAVAGFSLFGIYYFVLQPSFGADAASAGAHFGHLRTAVVWSQLATSQNLAFLGYLLGSLAFLPVLGWRFSIGASVPVGLAMLSQWPNATDPASHYPFLAMPFLILGTIDALAIVAAKAPSAMRWAIAAGVLSSMISYGSASVGPGGIRFNRSQYSFTPTAVEATRCLAAIPADVPALAPDHLVAHIVERRLVATSLRSPAQARRLRSALLDVDAIPWMSNAPRYDLYLASRRTVADHLQADLGFTQTMRCGPYLLLDRD